MRAGERWGAYVLERPLGSGSFADVWLARHAALGSRHAIKRLDPRWSENARIRARFVAEGRILAQLRHPHLVPVTDLLDDGPERLGLVMDLVDGETLAARIAREGPLPAREAVRLAAAIADGLHHAHEAGVVHRDLKPENVVLVGEGELARPVILDFGIAKVLADADVDARSTAPTRASMRLGTPQYMSPEQVESSHAVDRRADVFALGAVLYELLTGRPAFEGSTATEVLYHVVKGVYRPLVGVDRALAAVVDRALEVDPDARFQSAWAMREALLGLSGLAAAGPLAVEPPRGVRPPPRQPTMPTIAPEVPRRRAGWMLGAAAGLLLLAAGAAGLALVFTDEAASPALPLADAPPAEPPARTTPPDAPPSVEAPVVEPAGAVEPEPAPPAPRPLPPKPRPRPAPPPPPSDSQLVTAAWATLLPDLRACAVAGAPATTWKISVSLVAGGSVRGLAADATRPDPRVDACLERVAGRLSVPGLAADHRRVFNLPLP